MPGIAIGNPVSVALEYINERNNMITRYHTPNSPIMGNAPRVTQMKFIDMCNEYARRFAMEMPTWWNLPEWETFSRLHIGPMQRYIDGFENSEKNRIENLATWEAMMELSKTYCALLRMRNVRPT